MSNLAHAAAHVILVTVLLSPTDIDAHVQCSELSPRNGCIEWGANVTPKTDSTQRATPTADERQTSDDSSQDSTADDHSESDASNEASVSFTVDDAAKPLPEPEPDHSSHSGATEVAAPSQEPAAPPNNVLDEAMSFEQLEANVEASSPQVGSESTGRNASAARAGGCSTSMNPELSAILDVAAAYFSEDEPLQQGAHDPQKTGFNWQQLELALGAAVDPYLRFDSNLVFSPFGVEVEEAYATTLGLPVGLGFRFGQFLTRFGRANATHPHTWNFADQPFELGRLFGGEGERGLGIEASMLLPLPWSVELVASATDAAGQATARSFFGGTDLGVQSPKDLLYTTAVKQFFPLSDDWSLASGLSANFGPNSTGRDNRTDIYGADLYLKYRPLSAPEPPTVSLHTEWFYRRRQVPEALLQDYGQFTELMWHFSLRWAAAGRYEFGSAAYDTSGTVALDPLDPQWLQTRQRASASLSFYPTEFSRFRLQESRDMPGYRDAIWATFLTAEVVVGAHGAHAF